MTNKETAVPAYQIKAGNTELTKAEYAVSDISVDLSVGETCGACRFTLGHVYERGARKIQASMLDALKPGTLLSISLGYDSRYVPVFSGYVHELKLRFDGDEPEVIVFGLDARGLMRENTRGLIYKEKTISQIVNAILDDYATLITSRTVNMADWEQEAAIAQQEDDLSFLLNAAAGRGLLLYMANNQFVMDKPSSTVCAELDWEGRRTEFSLRYLDTSFTGIGCDPATAERFSAVKTAKAITEQAGLLTIKKHAPLASYHASQAAEVMNALAETAAQEAFFGHISGRGVPGAAVGQKVKINHFPLTALKTGDTFTVVSVGHRLDGTRGFTTEIGITG